MKKIGFIGGSGLYSIELENSKWITVDTHWGKPSDQILNGTIGNIEVFFLPRHGRGHVFTPSDVPYKANIAALKKMWG